MTTETADTIQDEAVGVSAFGDPTRVAVLLESGHTSCGRTAVCGGARMRRDAAVQPASHWIYRSVCHVLVERIRVQRASRLTQIGLQLFRTALMLIISSQPFWCRRTGSSGIEMGNLKCLECLANV